MITFNLPTDPAVRAAIGAVAVRQGQLDYTLKMTVKSITGISVREAIDATEGQGAAELRERVRKLARKKIGESEAMCRLDALLGRARRATRRRNELLHGLYAADLEGRELFRHEGHEFTALPSAQDLEAVADELHAVAGELNAARLDDTGFLKQALQRAI